MVGSDVVHGAAQSAVGPTRRALLLGGAAGGAALLAGCTGDDGPPEPPPPPHPDLVLADEAAVRERTLLQAYDLALQQRPDLAPLLAPLRAEHAEHVAALDVPELETPAPAGTGTTAPSPGGTSSPTPTASTPTPPLLPADPAAVPAALAELERSTAAAHAEAVLRAGRGLAVVLASAAASESSHAVALL